VGPKGEGGGETCLGTVASPTATPGNLCIYQNEANGAELENGVAKSLIRPDGTPPVITEGAGTSGAVVQLYEEGESAVTAFGSWAVTAAS
jgi:hypothetical protein